MVILTKIILKYVYYVLLNNDITYHIYPINNKKDYTK